MTAQDPDAGARRLSGEALRDGDPTRWFERLYADAAQGQAIVPWDRQAPHPLLVSGSSGNQLARCTAPLVVGGARRRCGVPSGPGIPCDRLRHLEICDRVRTAALPSKSVDSGYGLLNPPLMGSAFRSCGGSHHAVPPSLRPTPSFSRWAPARTGAQCAGPPASDGGELFDGPPWPLSRTDLESFAVRGSWEVVSVDELRDPPGMDHWRALFTRPPTLSSSSPEIPALRAGDRRRSP